VHIVYLIIALSLNALANILMKYANISNRTVASASTAEKITGLYLTWPFLIGLAAFGMNVIFYTQALAKMPLAVAYPIMTGTGFAIICLASYFLFSERLTILQLLGIFLIFVGIILVAQQYSAS
jgi:multidrug transporter EmrE-like cation transporter